MEIYVKFYLIYAYIFPFFLVFKHYFTGCVDFTCVTALNTASDDVTN